MLVCQSLSRGIALRETQIVAKVTRLVYPSVNEHLFEAIGTDPGASRRRIQFQEGTKEPFQLSPFSA